MAHPHQGHPPYTATLGLLMSWPYKRGITVHVLKKTNTVNISYVSSFGIRNWVCINYCNAA